MRVKGRGVFLTFLLRKEANAAIYSKRTRAAREGFAVAPILYLLAMAGVAAGVLFSGYSQILRTNINITNATTAKGDLTGGASTLAATSVFTSDQSVFCPPGGPDMSADCVAAARKVKMLSFAAAEAARRPRITIKPAIQEARPKSAFCRRFGRQTTRSLGTLIISIAGGTGSQ